MKNEIKRRLVELSESENKTYGADGIAKKVAELTSTKETLVKQRNDLNRQIKNLNALIKKWENEISPNQTSMF
jgi:predicted  nucleic acid-binding Zn-ribbon protein